MARADVQYRLATVGVYTDAPQAKALADLVVAGVESDRLIMPLLFGSIQIISHRIEHCRERPRASEVRFTWRWGYPTQRSPVELRAEVVFTNACWRPPQVALVCPTASTKTNREL